MSSRLSICAATVLATLAATSEAAAAPLVTNTNDAGAGSLRQAIIDAVPGDTIDVPAGTYTLTSGQLNVNKTLTLAGAGARTTTVTAGGTSRVFFTGGTPVRLSGMTITGGQLTITNVVDCQGGAGICNFGDLELAGVALVGNIANVTVDATNAPGGAGLFNNGDTVSIVDSTVAGNQANITINNSLTLAAGGAGYFNNGSATTITNSTISGNALTVNGSCTQPSGCRHGGGGIYANGNVNTLTNVTLADNSVGGTAPVSGGNFFVDNSPPSVFKNSIVSGGVAPAAANCDKFGTNLASSSGGNVESADTCGFSAGTDKPNTNPLLAALANNGGQTDTRALLAGSPAIDAAVDCATAADQRGVARPVGPACDSGAFEFAPPPPPPPPPPVAPPPPPPVDPEAGCVSATGSLSGKRLGPAKLGESQKRQRAALKSATRRSRGGVDRYCMRGGGSLGIAYPTGKLLQKLAPRLRKAVNGRVIAVNSSSKRYAVRGVRTGASVRDAAAKLKSAKKIQAGRRTWFVRRAGAVLQVALVRSGKVQSVGIADARLGASTAALKRLLAATAL